MSSRSSKSSLKKEPSKPYKPQDLQKSPKIDAKVLPKKALTAYQIFTRDMMKTMKNDPRLNQTSSKVRCQELMKITSQEWTTLDSKRKKIYEDKSALDLQRHRNQTNQNQMLGYFILENGMKSTEMPLDTK